MRLTKTFKVIGSKLIETRPTIIAIFEVPQNKRTSVVFSFIGINLAPGIC